jgi:murein DD-endopeptidase MepM/ murein hydrolase activator NlpD
VNPVLAIELSDIYAWAIDFFGIQKGDRYKVIYDELYVEDKFAGFGKIHAAVFENMGVSVKAYYFTSGSQSGYFDSEGNSLRKAFLKAPLNFSRISSRYSHSRMHPVLKYRRPHLGVDYAAPRGTPVYSIGDGVVVKKAYQKSGGGYYLTIKHNSVYTSQYMHLNGYARGMAPGVRVTQGQLIGYVGKTGLATGPHLDFRIYKNGSPVDPLRVKAPPVEPVSEENKPAFIHLRDSLGKQLDAIPFENLVLAEQ